MAQHDAQAAECVEDTSMYLLSRLQSVDRLGTASITAMKDFKKAA